MRSCRHFRGVIVHDDIQQNQFNSLQSRIFIRSCDCHYKITYEYLLGSGEVFALKLRMKSKMFPSHGCGDPMRKVVVLDNKFPEYVVLFQPGSCWRSAEPNTANDGIFSFNNPRTIMSFIIMLKSVFNYLSPFRIYGNLSRAIEVEFCTVMSKKTVFCWLLVLLRYSCKAL